jgi:hypothetical protein
MPQYWRVFMRRYAVRYGLVLIVWAALLVVIGGIFSHGSAQVRANDIVPEGAAQGATRLAYGTSIIGTVNPSSPVAFYSFSGAEGDLVNVQVVGMTPNMNPGVALLTNTQERLTTNNNDVFSPITGDASLSWFLPYNGLFLLVVSDAQGQSSDFVMRLDGRAAVQAPTLEPNVPVRIDLPAGSQAQYFLFSHQTDCPTTLTIVPETPEFPFAAHVRSVDGASVGIIRGGALKENRFTIPPDSGTYEVEIALADSTATGFVGLVITCLANAPFCDSPDDLGPLTPIMGGTSTQPTQQSTNPPPIVTRPPQQPNPQQPAATDTPEPPPVTDCSGFRLSSPRDGLANGFNTVYWDPAPNVTGYTASITNLDNGASTGGSTAPGTTSLTLDASTNGPLGAGIYFNVYVAAIRDGVVVCEDGQNMLRSTPIIPPENPPDDTVTGECGNNVCEEGESESCPGDCDSTEPECGNGQCESGEDSESCSADCGSTGPVCGNGQCESGEDSSTCSADCGSPIECGNGQCEAGEDSSTCSADCGSPPPVCPNGQCEAGEDSSSCPADCEIIIN